MIGPTLPQSLCQTDPSERSRSVGPTDPPKGSGGPSDRSIDRSHAQDQKKKAPRTFVVTFRALPACKFPILAVRALLKHALRVLGLRCTSIRAGSDAPER